MEGSASLSPGPPAPVPQPSLDRLDQRALHVKAKRLRDTLGKNGPHVPQEGLQRDPVKQVQCGRDRDAGAPDHHVGVVTDRELRLAAGLLVELWRRACLQD